MTENKKYGTVTVTDENENGTIIYLNCAAYVGSDPLSDKTAFFASGHDENGNEYQIEWLATDEWEAGDCEDFDIACEWDNPVEIRKV